eukprot:413122_1
MCTIENSEKWKELSLYPGKGLSVPNGIDKNNYIVIDYSDSLGKKINCIYKYNMDTDKWGKIDGFNNMENISNFSAALDINKQILFLLDKDCVTQIELKSNNISNYNYNFEISRPFSLESIIINDSLFIVSVGNYQNNSILKWNSENKKFIKFSDICNKME